jgi:quercetin dioxygenase-like cupin family protein
VIIFSAPDSELAESWLEGDDSARWRSTAGHGSAQGARSSASSLLELQPGKRLPRHTDSAEEAIVVIAGSAEVEMDSERSFLESNGGLAVVPAEVPHQVKNVGDEPLRFFAIYASNDVVTRYEAEVQPDGGKSRRPAG